MADPDRAAKEPHFAVVVVHGVGEVVPGEVADAMVATLGTAPDITVDKTYDVDYLPDYGAPGCAPPPPGGEAATGSTNSTIPSFPAHIRTAQFASGEKLTFAELHWADLADVGSGRVNTLLGLFRVVFEAHFLIGAMVDPNGGVLTRVLRFLLLTLSWCLRGPLAALTMCTAVICWIAINAKPDDTIELVSVLNRGAGLLPVIELSMSQAIVATMAVLALLSFAALGWAHARRDLTWQPTLLWIAVWAVVISAWAQTLVLAPALVEWSGFVIEPGAGLTASSSITSVYQFLISLWRIWGALYLLCLLLVVVLAGHALWTVLRSAKGRSANKRSRLAGAMTATGALAIQFFLWTAITGTALLPLLNRSEEIVALTVVNKAMAQVPGKFVEAHIKKNDPRVDWRKETKAVEKLLAVPHFESRRFDWIDRFKYAYGFNGFAIFTFVCVFLILVAMRWALAKRFEKNLDRVASAMPRLLFNTFATSVLLGFMLIQILINVIFSKEVQLVYDFVAGGGAHNTSWLGDAVDEIKQALVGSGVSEGTVKSLVLANKYLILGVAALLALALPLAIGRRLNNALHIARDLIDHHYGPGERRAAAQSAAGGVAEAALWPRRWRIKQRLLTLLDDLRARGPIEGVVFVAHSQGSVIVYDYLLASAPHYEEIDGIKPALVTCGSPLTHLYQQYFQEYADLDRQLERLHETHLGWANVYRVDDYIGTWVGPKSGAFVSNEVLPRGGHSDYWREARLSEAVMAALQNVKLAKGSGQHRAHTRPVAASGTGSDGSVSVPA